MTIAHEVQPGSDVRSGSAERIGVMVCGHGSRDAKAVAEFAALATLLEDRFPDWPVDYGYLEFARPVIRDGLDRLAAAGVTRILAVPGMLFAAGHAKNDIPSVLNTYAAGRPGLSVEYGRELGIDPKMLQAAADRIRETLAAAPDLPAHETLLVVVGRGASDPDANSNVAKVTRMLWEGFGFGWAETAYSGVTFPLVAPALEKAARLGFRRIVVFPYFLFTGILVDRIYAAADEAAARHPGIEFLKAPYLAGHPLVIDTFVERVREILTGDNRMNCGLCKYRTQVLGFEAEVGLPQESHHHHVEGIGTGQGAPRHGHAHDHAPGHRHDHDHDHHHHHDDGHDHLHAGAGGHGHHHPYPHADHPLGPRTLKRG
ncbi:sirohydrochlorin chelatase [Propylenella binzhouense]|uniref:Sirohydrochlorin chelatase n=1 Tax=Propylenella binzhouense TaxID=2555902 RepID=A0A964T3X5_9HYPH|nr:sirohydrochlorin chelatase [Propylenella binzhouense]MYZ48008.1 sirohydrochlorin chelatase [Propylenella binzhouense]